MSEDKLTALDARIEAWRSFRGRAARMQGSELEKGQAVLQEALEIMLAARDEIARLREAADAPAIVEAIEQIRAEERKRVLAEMEKLSPEAIRAGGDALERQYRASLWEEAKEVAEEADVEAIWHAMFAVIRAENIGESEERTTGE